MTVAPAECHSVADMKDAAIVGSQHEIGTFAAIADITERALKLTNVAGGSSNVQLRVVHLVAWQSQMVCRRGHNLHQTLGTGKRGGSWVEGRFLIALGGHQTPIPAYRSAVLYEERVVVADDATLAVEHGREDAALDASAAEEIGFLTADFFQYVGGIPGFQLFSQLVLCWRGLQPPHLGTGHDVAFVSLQTSHHLSGVPADLDTKPHA